jgi:anti-sigma regulatory factor (Ser/Thr protein kinase)
VEIHLPNSAHLQNIQGFIRKYDPTEPNLLNISGHPNYIHVHPFALVMAACAGEAAHARGATIQGRIPEVASIPYLVRMGLYRHLHIPEPRQIEAHEEAGRFVPITQIQTSQDLTNTITNLIPLLHASQAVADPIRYVVSELGRNVLEHSQSPVGGFVCAQYFKETNRIAIGMADAGIGIFSAMRRFHEPNSEVRAMQMALTPGISGATSRIGGNETNAGAGLFFIRSIAKTSGNFFFIYSGNTSYKLLRKQKSRNLLYADPFAEGNVICTDLPYWQGTAIGIDISVDETREFAGLLNLIRQSYQIGVKGEQKKKYYEGVKFT